MLSIIYILSSIIYDIAYDIVYDISRISYTISYVYRIRIIRCRIRCRNQYRIRYLIRVYKLRAVLSEIRLINSTINNAKPGNPMYRKPLAQDQSEKLIEVHVAALKWHMQSRMFEMTAEMVKLNARHVRRILAASS